MDTESLLVTRTPLAKPQKFEDLVVWQRARGLTKKIYAITKTGKFSTDRGMSSQVQRCSVSIMANIAEGFARRGPAEFAHYISIALGSCAETKSHFYVALNCGYISESEMRELYDEAEEIAKMLNRLQQNAMKAKSKGQAN